VPKAPWEASEPPPRRATAYRQHPAGSQQKNKPMLDLDGQELSSIRYLHAGGQGLPPARPHRHSGGQSLSPGSPHLHFGGQELSPGQRYLHAGGRDLSLHPNEQSPLVGDPESPASLDHAHRSKLSRALSLLPSRFPLSRSTRLPISCPSGQKERQRPTVVAGICVGKTQGRKKESSSPSESLYIRGPNYFIDLQTICFQYAWRRA